MPYANVTKQKIPHVYPLSTPIEGVDGEVLLFPIGVRFSAKRGSGATESHQNQGAHQTKVATLHRYKIVVGGLEGQYPTAACGRLQPGSVTRSIVKFLDFRGGNSPFWLELWSPILLDPALM